MMNWSLQVARVQGIPIRIHVTFLLTVFYFAFQGWSLMNGAMKGAAIGAASVSLLFVCVVLHELGHSLVAQAFGEEVRDITLWPIGGVARLSGMPKRPWQELLVSVAGPLVNVLLAFGLALVALIWLGPDRIVSHYVLQGIFFPRRWELLPVWLLGANVFLAAFNLVPAFPMDGGRILRAILATFMSYTRATRLAVRIGQGFAILFGLLGLLPGQFILLVIAIFIFMGAGQEGRTVVAHGYLRRLGVRDVLQPVGRVLNPWQPLTALLPSLLHTQQSGYAVVDESTLAGIVTENDLIGGLRKHGERATVKDIMRTTYPRLSPDDSLLRAQELMQEHRLSVLPVIVGQRLQGFVTASDINRALRLSDAYPQAFQSRAV
ncbi:MAG TPA: site-2 protease family protein [Anaerolineae bacterium]|nr:site-2 protease family protein [Anaerolineae bacterium]HIQ06028.1 site-2 protease family protein [Anaerolineae bacterium]